jgi:YVTN family beta-propeller protein
MTLRLGRPLALGAFVGCVLAGAQALAQNAYITNSGDGTVSVIDTATNTVTATIPVGSDPLGVVVTPDGSKVYVANTLSGTVSVIDTTTNPYENPVSTISLSGIGGTPTGVAVSPDGSKVYVANSGNNTVSVIDTASNTVISTITDPSFNNPVAFGVFIPPGPKFAGTPGKANCLGQSVSALAKQYGGLRAAAAALGFDSVKALQEAILDFCELPT